MSEGLFIVLEGVEGAGKSTQALLLSRWMEDLGIPHVLAREPGGTPVGEAMPPETELFLILAARAAFTRDVVRPALAQGRVVLADRYDFSTFAYQGYGRGLALPEVRRANDLATGGLVPDLVLVLDLPVEQGMERKGSHGPGDRIEREGRSFLERVRDGYLALATEEPRARILSGRESPRAVQIALRKALAETFPGTFPSVEGEK